VDEKGNTHFTTRYDRIPQQYRNQVSEPPEETEQKQLMATEEEVRQFVANYMERYNQKDIDGFLSLFSPKAILRLGRSIRIFSMRAKNSGITWRIRRSKFSRMP
jgi:hypothetical protein